MDLGTLRKKLKEKKFNFIGDALDDLQLIWNNCKTYNSKGCEIWKIAQLLEKQSVKLIEKFMKFTSKEIKKDETSTKQKESVEKTHNIQHTLVKAKTQQ